MSAEITGNVWKFGDHMNTDVIFPGKAFRMDVAEQSRVMFEAMRPEWHSIVEPGDIIVGGRSFGIGSARPIGVPLLHLGVAAVLAESMSSIFQRNCINAGLFALGAPGISSVCDEGDELTISPETGAIYRRDKCVLRFQPLPPQVAAIVDAGGIMSQLRRDGYLPPESATGVTVSVRAKR